MPRPMVVLITGASSGIGRAIATRLSDRGFSVFGTSRRARPSSGKFNWIKMDVRNDDSVSSGVESVAATAGRIDALVCNAGYGVFGSVEEVNISSAKEQFETNVFGVMRSVQAVLPGMRSQKHGRIVIIGSLAGRAPIPFQAHYSASKAAIDTFSQSLLLECRPFGIRVSLIEPGDINTAFNENADWQDTSQSVYGQDIQRSAEVVKKSLLHAPDPDIVAKTVEKALSADVPHYRYSVGPDAWNVSLGRRFLPERWFHWFIANRYIKPR